MSKQCYIFLQEISHMCDIYFISCYFVYKNSLLTIDTQMLARKEEFCFRQTVLKTEMSP